MTPHIDGEKVETDEKHYSDNIINNAKFFFAVIRTESNNDETLIL